MGFNGGGLGVSLSVDGGQLVVRVVCGFQWWWLVGFGKWVLILI